MSKVISSKSENQSQKEELVYSNKVNIIGFKTSWIKEFNSHMETVYEKKKDDKKVESKPK